MEDTVPIITSKGYDFKCSSIKFCWEMNLEDYKKEHLELNILPAPYIDLIFPVQSSVFIKTDNERMTRPFISPILHSRKEVIFNKGSRIFGIRITPILACAILKAPLSILEQKANLLDDLCPQPFLNKLRSILYSELDFSKKIVLVDCMFFKANLEMKHNFKLLSNCLYQISHFPEYNVERLAKTSGYSSRWLEKKFLVHFGLTPIQLISISRLNRFIALLANNPQAKLTSMAVDAGYYDQSHAIRDLKKYTEKTPRDFKKTIDSFRETMNHL